MIEIEEERFEIKLTTLEHLFTDSPTGGISVFKTLALPEDDKDANKILLQNFRKTFKNTLSNEEIRYHIDNIQEIRKMVLQDESMMMALEDRINEISTRITTNLIIDENNLMLTGDFEHKDE